MSFPHAPHGYHNRDDVEKQLLDHLLSHKVTILTNEENNNSSSGKTSTTSYICEILTTESHFTDGIIWLSMSDKVMNWMTFGSFLEYLLTELHRLLCPELEHFLYDVIDQQNIDGCCYNLIKRIHELMMFIGPNPQVLVVLDDVSSVSLLKPLESLGLTFLMTTRSCSLSESACIIQLPTRLESMPNHTIYDIDNGGDGDDGQSSFMTSLSTLLQSAYKLGYQDHATSRNEECQQRDVPGSLATKLLCNYSTMRKDMKLKLLLLSSLPVGEFLPLSLVYYIWSCSSVQGQSETLQSQEDDIILFHRNSLIQLSFNKDMLLIPNDTHRLIHLILCQNSFFCDKKDEENELTAIKEDSVEILEYALVNDKEEFLSFQFERCCLSLAKCFVCLEWSEDDVIKKYDLMFEKEIESSQFSSKNYNSQLITLTSIEQVIKILMSSFSIEQKRSGQLFNNHNSMNVLFKWCYQWFDKIIDFKETLYDLYHDNDLPPLEHCETLSKFAEITIRNGCINDSIKVRKDIIKIQREYLNDNDIELGMSLFYLAHTGYLSLKTNQSGKSNDSIPDEAEVEKMSRLALRFFEELEQSSVTISIIDSLMKILCEILINRSDKVDDVLTTLQDILSSRKEYYNKVYHPQIADIYHDMAALQLMVGNTDAAIKLMNKNIRIVRHVFGDCNYHTANMLEYLADCFLTQKNISRAESLMTKAIGIQQILSQQDGFPQSALISSLQKLNKIVTERLTSDRAKKQEQTNPNHQNQFASPKSFDSKSKHPTGQSKEDAVLLIAMADRIFRNDHDHTKAKKYLYKSLKILAQLDLTVEKYDFNEINIFKWSAYNKLAEISSDEGNIQEGAKYYQKALKGFLSINLDIYPGLRDHKNEAIVVAYNLAHLVDESMGFQAAIALYLKVIDIVTELNTLVSDVENNQDKSSSRVTHSQVDHAATLILIADRFEDELQNNEGLLSLDDPKYSGAMNGIIRGSVESFLVHLWTLAVEIYIYHVGLEDERTLQCQEKLKLLRGDKRPNERDGIEIYEQMEHHGDAVNNSTISLSPLKNSAVFDENIKAKSGEDLPMTLNELNVTQDMINDKSPHSSLGQAIFVKT